MASDPRARRLRRLEALLPLLAGGALALGGCREEAPAAASPAPPPPGAVLRVAGEPVFADEVEAIADRLAVLEPAFTRPHLLRLALSNVVLPRAFARTEDPERWRSAREELEALVADLGAEVVDLTPIPGVEERSGDFEDIGLATWIAAQEAPPGGWSAPYEESGAWCAVRVLSRDPSAPSALEPWRVAVAAVPFVRDRSNLIDRMLAARLEILDAAWTDLVPASWRYRMGAVPREDSR